ncbi:hypothetical protein B0H14DRAFT_1130193 [Mycena olivaceomarginata]|nr:hypothetical protein B0H14DRAFT_1130193 [Mycena olivaceomarginata]
MKHMHYRVPVPVRVPLRAPEHQHVHRAQHILLRHTAVRMRRTRIRRLHAPRRAPACADERLQHCACRSGVHRAHVRPAPSANGPGLPLSPAPAAPRPSQRGPPRPLHPLQLQTARGSRTHTVLVASIASAAGSAPTSSRRATRGGRVARCARPGKREDVREEQRGVNGRSGRGVRRARGCAHPPR